MTGADIPFVRTPEANFEGLADFPFEPHYLDLDGLRMHYLDVGPADGPVSLLLHGMPTWGYLYRQVIPVLVAAGYRCVVPDHVGFGRSDKVTDPGYYDVGRHRANLSRLVQQLDLRDITLFVQDWGGPIGLAQVVGMPERFTRVVIMNTWLHHDRYSYSPAIRRWIEQNQPGGLFRDHIPDRFGWGSLMAVATGRTEPATAIIPAVQGQPVELSGDAEAVRQAYDAPFAGLGPEAVVGARQFPLSIPLYDGRRGDGDGQARHFEAINSMALPVHFVWGLADDIFTGEWGRHWHSLVAGSTWDAFEDAGHFLQDTHGARIAELVLGHIGKKG